MGRSCWIPIRGGGRKEQVVRMYVDVERECAVYKFDVPYSMNAVPVAHLAPCTLLSCSHNF